MPISFSVSSLLVKDAAVSSFSVINAGNGGVTVMIEPSSDVLLVAPKMVALRAGIVEKINVRTTAARTQLPADRESQFTLKITVVSAGESNATHNLSVTYRPGSYMP